MPQNHYFRVKFPAGHTKASFDINIINDDDIEGSETFRVYIFDLSVPYGVSLGRTTSATVVIVDDDSKQLYTYKHILYIYNIIYLYKHTGYTN